MNFTVPHPEDNPSSDVKAGAGVRQVDLSRLVAQIAENDAQRWMLVKNRLDHGPFSGREIVKMVLEGEARRGHTVANLDNGMRQRIEDHPEFCEFLAEREERERRDAARAAISASETREQRGNVTKLTVVIVILAGLVAVAGTVFLMKRAQRQTAADFDKLAALFDRGDVQVESTVDLLPQVRKGKGRRRGTKAKSGTAGSYEAAMMQAVNLGDVTRGGSEQQLTGSQVASVLDRNQRRFFPCVSTELRSGQRVSQVSIDIAIAGSGEVMGVSVRSGSKAFQQCIAGKVQAIRFPKFSAPRMGVRYGFSFGK